MLHLSHLHSNYSASVYASPQGGKQRGAPNIFAALLSSLGSVDSTKDNLSDLTKIRIDINGDPSLKSSDNLKSKLVHLLKKSATDPRWKNLLNQWNQGKVDIFLPIQVQSIDRRANVASDFGEAQISKSLGLLRVFKTKTDGNVKLSQLKSSQVGVGFVFDEQSAEALKSSSSDNSKNSLSQNLNVKNNRDNSGNSLLLAFSNSLNTSFFTGRIAAGEASNLQFAHFSNGSELKVDGHCGISDVQQTNGKHFDLTGIRKKTGNTFKNRSEFVTGMDISADDIKVQHSDRNQSRNADPKKNFSAGQVDETPRTRDHLKNNQSVGWKSSKLEMLSENKIPDIAKLDKQIDEGKLNSGKLTREPTSKSSRYSSDAFGTRTVPKTSQGMNPQPNDFVPSSNSQQIDSNTSNSAQSIHTNSSTQDIASDSTVKIQQDQTGANRNQTMNTVQFDPEPTRLVYVNLDGGAKSKSLQDFSTKNLAKLLEKLHGNVQFSSIERKSQLSNNQNLTAVKRKSDVAQTLIDNPKARSTNELVTYSNKRANSAFTGKTTNSQHSQRVINSISKRNQPNIINVISQTKQPERFEIATSGFSSTNPATHEDKPQNSQSAAVGFIDKSHETSYSETAHKGELAHLDRIRNTDYTPKNPNGHSFQTALDNDKQSTQPGSNAILQGKPDFSGVIANSARSSAAHFNNQNQTMSVMHQVIQRFESMTQQIQSGQVQSRGNWLQARIALKPAELGSVMLTLRFKDDVLQGKIVTESRQSKHAIEKHLPAIQEAMNKHHTSVQNIKVEVRSYFESQHNQPNFQQQFSDQSGSGKQPGTSTRSSKQFISHTTPEQESVDIPPIQHPLSRGQINFYA